MTAAPPDGAPATSAGGRRVLVVDDDDDGRVILERFLALDGFAAWSAASPAEAVAVAARHGVAAAIVTFGRHPEDGIALVRALRATDVGCDGPIIGILTVCYADTLEAAAAAGCTATRFKPIDLLDLRSTLEHLLGP